MKKIAISTISIIALLFLPLFISAQEKASKTYDYRGFKEIDVSASFEVEISKSSNYKVLVEYPADMEDQLRIEMDGEELKLNLKGGKSKGRPKAIIQMPNLEELEVSGASSVSIKDFQGENLDLEVSGASKVRGDIHFNTLKAELSGASVVQCIGRVNSAKIYASGASKFGTDQFTIAGELVLDCSGASQVTSIVNGDMYIEMSGASKFDCKGEGHIVKQDVTGASKVNLN